MLLEAIERQGSRGLGTHRLLPHPVERPRALDRLAASAAIPELLAAFRAADLAANDHLLIAGSLYEPHRALVRSAFADLLTSGRIVSIDRH